MPRDVLRNALFSVFQFMLFIRFYVITMCALWQHLYLICIAANGKAHGEARVRADPMQRVVKLFFSR